MNKKIWSKLKEIPILKIKMKKYISVVLIEVFRSFDSNARDQD